MEDAKEEDEEEEETLVSFRAQVRPVELKARSRPTLFPQAVYQVHGKDFEEEKGQGDPSRAKVCHSELCQGGQFIHPFLRVGSKISWWRQFAPREVVELILGGIEPQWPSPGVPSLPQARSQKQVQLAQKVLQDYVTVGAAKIVPLEEAKYLVPWFVLQNVEDNGKGNCY